MSGQALVRASARRVLFRSYNVGIASNFFSGSQAITTTSSDNHYSGGDYLLSRQQQQQHVTSRFSSSGGSVKEDLSAMISREIAEENESESNVMPVELKDLMDQLSEDWRIVNTNNNDGSSLSLSGEGEATIQMFKKDSISGAIVRISFHCQDSIVADDDDIMEEDEEENEEDEEEDAVAIKFTVHVTRAGKTIVFNCLSMDSEASVESVFLTEDDAAAAAQNNNKEQLYQGPEYTELAEDLQDMFTAFVQTDCGVDENVAAFISMYADYKEQVEYIQWLKGIKAIVHP
mmetsp:Transcript_7078/g.6710  ORF Transcript_7078/g.6710 Transcript_7078/m.6710 type:complete len:289 (-) Transcript_7078:192-1058(-)|eukprot:CAMPEP_0197835216 /NCGR_PEP_ID=MMETSP1437-20131217/25136_1 /TAXON_ID=49252 ORGANISM="Eucampia antarctica, Strain CCMP1452" /NCGR_SAMPLE_ID=MMETSP1437 /ASSEMBLY_ACC=CAM_ASM_001096 /LENGTH=288 /DNA_ID=CAMNT_0043440471 /DNA_START=63 /DNA_END=929 /DNA_ORIENTATION=-